MLFFAAAWLPLLLVCWLCGRVVLERAAVAGTFDRAGDRLILSLWLGLVILAQLLLGASHFGPLTPLCGAALGATVSGIALLWRGVRAEAVRLKELMQARPRLVPGLLALVLGVAAFASQPITYFDTGLYHFQNIKWLSEYGAVGGVGIIHDRFAFTPAWFALAAPFAAGPFETRAAAVADGFALLVACLHALVCVRRCASGEGRGSDWLAVLSFMAVMPPALVWRMPASASPDMPGFFLAVAVVWAVCLLEEEWGAAARGRLVPVLLAAGAVGVKLNAVPLLVVACVYYVAGEGLTVGRALRAGGAVALLLLPALAHRVFVSGCPLYPSKALCLDVPWAVGVQQAELHTMVIREWARWEGTGLPWSDGWGWVVPWATKGFTLKNSFVIPLCLFVAGAGAFARARRRWRAAGALGLTAGGAGLLLFFLVRGGEVLMVALALAAVVVALRRRGRGHVGRGWVFAAGLLGTALILYAAPALRFGLGYTGILFGSLLVPAAVGLAGEAYEAGVWWRRRATLATLLTVCGLFLFMLTIGLEVGTRVGAGVEGRGRRLLVPPPLPEVATTAHEVGGVRYFVPAVGEQCWAAELPCVSSELPDDVRLRDPERGPAAGFVHIAGTPHR